MKKKNATADVAVSVKMVNTHARQSASASQNAPVAALNAVVKNKNKKSPFGHADGDFL